MATLGPFDFTGGYSPGYDFTTLPQKNYATIMENMKIKSGYASPRWKSFTVNTALGSSGNTVTNITSWNDTVNSKLALVLTFVDSGPTGKLFIVDATSWNPMVGTLTFVDRSGAISSASLSGSTIYDSLNNLLVGTGNSANSGVPFKVTAYNANGAALGGSPPSADTCKQVNNFMFLSRNLSSTTTQSNVYWSNVNDPETWTGANVLSFRKNDGEPIMALGCIGTDLYIFKQTSIGRLSTVSLTVSGAVTLGPLITVIQGKGCCGPRALDNIPNGNIVFVGFDGHFYEFDGSTLVDRSRDPNPGHNVYDNGDFSATHTAFGLTSLLAGVDTCVKVLRGINEVWIGYQSSMRGLNQQSVCYNFEQNAWQGSGPNQLVSMTTIPMPPLSITAYYNDLESTEILISGSVVARVDASQFNTPYPWTHGGATSFSIGTTIELPETKDGPFIPRSLCFTTDYTASSGATLASFFVYADFDIYTPTTQVYSATASTVLPTRVVVPLSFRQDPVGTNIFPKFISVLFTGTGQGTVTISASSTSKSEILRIGKIWISDEILR